MKVAIIVNDTRRDSHSGCEIVVDRIYEECLFAGIRVIAALQTSARFRECFERKVRSCDLVIVNGEGTMHDDSRAAGEIAWAGQYAHELGKPVFLINSVWQSNHNINHLLSICEMVCVRESFSYSEISAHGCLGRVVPDLVFSSTYFDYIQRDTIGCLNSVLVIDDVRADVSAALKNFSYNNGNEFLTMGVPSLSRKLRSKMFKVVRKFDNKKRDFYEVNRMRRGISKAGIVVSGRFHGVCMAILTGRPFVAYSSNTHKIEGLLCDAKLGDGGVLLDDATLLTGNGAGLIKEVSSLRERFQDQTCIARYQAACAEYVDNSRQMIRAMFGDIGGKVRESNR